MTRKLEKIIERVLEQPLVGLVETEVSKIYEISETSVRAINRINVLIIFRLFV